MAAPDGAECWHDAGLGVVTAGVQTTSMRSAPPRATAVTAALAANANAARAMCRMFSRTFTVVRSLTLQLLDECGAIIVTESIEQPPPEM